ncbi:MAG: hypothetical protein AB1397_02705 [bacterium]
MISKVGYSLCWKHWLGNKGVGFEITLADGLVISSENIKGVINRLLSISPNCLKRVKPDDRNYAQQEFFAFFLSWLYSIPCPILNPPTPQGLSGQWRHISEWIYLASKAGLPITPYRQGSKIGKADLSRKHISLPVNTAIVVARYVIGEGIDSDILKACQRLAELAKTPLLGIDFAFDLMGGLRFIGATPLPDLRLGGERLLSALASVLLER